MKNYLAMAILGITFISSCKQKVKESEVPKEIIEAFNINFKGSTVETWEKEKDGGYEAEFNLNGEETSATFGSDGTLKETEQEINKTSLPVAITEYLKTNYAGKSIDETAKITTGEGAIKYEVEVEKKDLIFDDKGSLIK